MESSSASTDMCSVPSLRSRTFRVRSSTVAHEQRFFSSSCCQRFSMARSPSAVSRRSPSLSLVSCVIPRRISLAQRLCAAVTTSDWPAHQALWMCPTVSRSSWASFQVGRSRRQISHLLDPRLPILHRKAPHGKEFVTTWMSRRRLWKGMQGLLSHLCSSNRLWRGLSRKSAVHVPCAGLLLPPDRRRFISLGGWGF